MGNTIRNRNVSPAKRRSSQPASAVFWTRLAILLQIIALLGGIFGLFSYRVSLGEKLTLTARETAKVKQQIHDLEREIEAMRIKKEMYSEWSYVKKQIDTYQLGLRPAEPLQREALVVRQHGRTSSAGNMQTARR